MTYEEWVKTLSEEDQIIFNRLSAHNMSLKIGHNGNMYVDKEWLSRPEWNDSRYHYSSLEYENALIEMGINSADYPLVNNTSSHRWITYAYKRH